MRAKGPTSTHLLHIPTLAVATGGAYCLDWDISHSDLSRF